MTLLDAYYFAAAAAAMKQLASSSHSSTDPVIYIAHPFTSNKYISTWNFSKGQFDSRTFGAYKASSPNCVSVSPCANGLLAAVLTGGVNKLVIFNSDTEAVVAEIDGTFTKIIGWRPTTYDVLAVLDGSGYIKFYDTSTWTTISGYSSTTVFTDGEWTPDGAYIALGSSSGGKLVNWSTKTAFTSTITMTGGAIATAKGRTGTNFCVFSHYYNTSTSTGYFRENYYSSSTSLSTYGAQSGAAINSSAGFVNIASSAGYVAGILSGFANTYSFFVRAIGSYSGPPGYCGLSTPSNAQSVTWNSGGGKVAISPSGRYILGRISAGTLPKQFNYYDTSLLGFYAGFDTGLTINDFKWDPRGSL